MIWTFDKDGVPTAPYSVFRLDSFWACETPEGVLEVAGKLPWGQWPAFSFESAYQRIHYQGFRGWESDLWYDGPELRWNKGLVTACVMPGSDAELPSHDAKDRQGFAAWQREREALAWKKSLAQAFRARFSYQGSFQLTAWQHHPRSMLSLLGLRLAFPHSNFYALDYPSELKPQWKRFCQNLNLSTWAAPAQLRDLPLIPCDDISRLWPEDSSAIFLKQLNTRIPVVPGKLAALFNSP